MKRELGLLLLLSSLLLALPAWAEETRGGNFTVTPMVGWHQFDGNQYLESRPSGGLAVGYDFRSGWSVEGAGTYIDTYHNWRGRGGSVDVYTVRLDVLKHFRYEQQLVPYLVAGAGALLTEEEERNGGDKNEDFLFAYGVGLKYYLPEQVALRLDLRHLIDYANAGDDDLFHNAALTFGITVPIGRKTAPATRPAEPGPVAAPPVESQVVVGGDSDGDGVADSADRCEMTPPGTPVDESGCPRTIWRDADGDGIADGNDRCPNTPAQVPVNPLGCPRDSDGDLVFDIDDRCPGTPQGVAVDASGCPVAR